MKKHFSIPCALLLAPVGASAQVAISQLPSATTPLGGTEIVPIVQGGVTKNVTTLQISAVGPGATNVAASGADRTGATDSSTVVNAVLAAGATDVYFPAGTFKLCNVVLPNTANLIVHGEGPATRIVQGNCGYPVFHWPTSAMAYNAVVISDLWIDATAGNAHSIDTTGHGTVALERLYFNNTPAGYDNIYVNGAASSFTHDVRVIDNRFYSQAGAPNGNAKIEFGPLAADSLVSHNVGNGNFLDAYGVKIDAGAATIVSIQSDFYNVTSRALYVLGCQNCQFSQDVWTTGTGGPNATVTATYSTFAGEQFEGATAGNDALQLVNSVANTFTGTIWGASVTGAGYTVNESGSSNYNIFIGGNLNTLSYWATPPFHFIGAQSYALNVPGYSTLGIRFGFSGATVSTQAQNTTVYLGVNGAQASATNTAYVSPYTSNVNTATIAVDVTPASGQTYAFTLYDTTTSTALGTCSIANGSYGCSITGSGTVNAGDSVSVKSVFSATSGAANVRYSIAMTA